MLGASNCLTRAGLLGSRIKDPLKHQMIDSLNDIGWTITDDGVLTTTDAILSEQFFHPERRSTPM